MDDIIVGIVAVLTGAVFCFRGYLAMRIIIPIWGAFAGFMLGAGIVAGDSGFLATALGWFVGIAVALLGRNTAIGVGLGALLFGSLLTGTSTRNLDPEIFRPELASNLTLLIQGLVVLFVGADVAVLWVLRQLRLRRGTA